MNQAQISPISTHDVLNSAAIFLNSDPLQLHHSDHPNFVLTTNLLTPGNYHHWRRSVEISLLAKNKIKFVNGDFPRPLDHVMATQWDRCDGMVKYNVI
ncbi:hypothetical protein LIER_17638 [Lithospermum erythrorhizon]|uniref:Retrotransposon Copia-like N-terminal domain-containing protein n=1 Tax=Lithospermum erythrorhizon TaxID=34254 RepID=A0AAV3QB36_LITER